MTQWDWALNDSLELDPKSLSQGSMKKAHWNFPCGHKGVAEIRRRVAGHGCGSCGHRKSSASRRIPKAGRSLADLFPEISAEWDTQKNRVDARSVASGSNLAYFWICPLGHSYDMSPNARTRGRKCPYCRGLRVGQGNDLATLRPDLAAEWDWDANQGLTPDKVTPGSAKACYWRCRENSEHRWSATPANRRTRGCPYCSKRLVNHTNNIQITHPNLAAEWDGLKNFPLLASQVTGGSYEAFWWNCMTCGHKWRATAASRSRGAGCPKCADQRKREIFSRPAPGKSIADLAPDLAAEWHPTRNQKTPLDLGPGSGIPVWWRCSRGHVWQATPDTRTRIGSGCERCQMGSSSAREIRIFCELSFVLRKCGFRPGHGVKIPSVPRRFNAVDMLFSDADESQPGIVVEYDGAWWHEEQKVRNDQSKTEALLDAGFGVMRVREEPLPRITESDISVSRNEDEYRAALKALVRMVELDWIGQKNHRHIEEYRRTGVVRASRDAASMIHSRGGYILSASAAQIRGRVSRQTTA
ncbi:zinc-ribbon domain-containing protein [Streptomyces mirabilis]|uniref:zinc-ribbon domain-containing protein n=1 Tax=Streptomyces mirabilis TaxID=68239 RepID=UPI00382F8750